MMIINIIASHYHLPNYNLISVFVKSLCNQKQKSISISNNKLRCVFPPMVYQNFWSGQVDGHQLSGKWIMDSCRHGFKKQFCIYSKTNRWIVEKIQLFHVDDVVVFNQILRYHVEYLNHIFNLFEKMNIVLKFSKSYIGYPTIVWLNKKTTILGWTF